MKKIKLDPPAPLGKPRPASQGKPFPGGPSPATVKGATTKRRTGGRKAETLRVVDTILDEILLGTKQKRIAEKYDLHPNRVSQICNSPEFQQALAEAREQRRHVLLDQIAGLASHALRAHLTILQTEADPAAKNYCELLKIKAQSADSILDRVGLERGARLSQSATTATTVVHEFASRTEAELDYFIAHGFFPEETKRTALPGASAGVH